MKRTNLNESQVNIVRRDNRPEAAGSEKGQQIIPAVVGVIWIVAVSQA